MSPLKRIIQKIAGVELDVTAPIRLRAFGKLPSGTEYLHLDAGSGASRVFPDWVKAGHDLWIERTARETRGRTVPTRLLLQLPGLKDQVVCAQVWASRDGAGRIFPFTLFATVDVRILQDPANTLAVGAQLWSHMEAAFWPIFEGQIELSSLRERTLSTDIGRRPIEAPRWVESARGITWEDWARAIAASAGCKNERGLAERLDRAVVQWRSGAANLALRLPMSRRFDLLAQAAAWMAWLRRTALSGAWPPSGLVLPHPEAPGTLFLTCLARPPIPSDFQLLTSDADCYECVEGLREIDRPGSGSRTLPPPGTSLWSWAAGPETGE